MIYKKRFDTGDIVEVSRTTWGRALLVPVGRKKKRVGPLTANIPRRTILLVVEDTPGFHHQTLCLYDGLPLWVDTRNLTFLRGKEPGDGGVEKNPDTRMTQVDRSILNDGNHIKPAGDPENEPVSEGRLS